MDPSVGRQRHGHSRIKNLFLGGVSLGIYGVIRLYVATLRKSCLNCEEYRRRYARNEGMLIAFWHNQLLAMRTVYYGQPFGLSTLVSRSQDGDIAARVLHYWKLGTVRGSSHRGGIQALKELLRLASQPSHHLALAPDGPQGPPFEVKEGLILLAQKTGRPITPLAVAFQRYLQLNSWDGFLLPFPFTKAYFVCGDPVHIPPDLDIEEARLRVTRALQDVNAFAVSQRSSPKGA